MEVRRFLNIIGLTCMFYAWMNCQNEQPEGQGIPRGLHVRMNLQTGDKEAKLLDADDANSQQPTFGKKTVKELKAALRLLPTEAINERPGDLNEEGLKKFRSIEEIQKELENLNINITTEGEVMQHLLRKFMENGEFPKQQASILMDLEYYVHQYDNAVDFVKMSGLPLAMLSLNSSDESLRTAAAFLMGSAMQSNPYVQVFAVDNGALQILLQHLAVDPSTAVQIKCLYAISCMMRHFPHAQKKFIELGGFSVLDNFFEMRGENMKKLQIKTVTLLYDTIMESQLTSEHASTDGFTVNAKLNQYAQVNIKQAVKQLEFCQHIPRLLLVPDHDTREKVFLTMSVLTDICGNAFLEYAKQLEALKREYSQITSNETGNMDTNDQLYFSELSTLIDVILGSIKKHDEL